MKGLRNISFDKDLYMKFCIYKEKSVSHTDMAMAGSLNI
jgi:hypothetical protein